MTDQAKTLRSLMVRRQTVADVAPADSTKSAFTVAVTSGKGGVGKSNVALNLALALGKLDKSVCLLDANLGLGNIDLMCGLNGYWNLSHVVSGARSLKEIILDGPFGVRVIPGASGLSEMADCPSAARLDILAQMGELERSHDFLIVDTGTGIHRAVMQFVTPADLILIVTTPEPTSIADAYATVKTLSTGEPLRLEVLVNQAETAAQARVILSRLQQTSRVFLHSEVEAAGFIPHDFNVVRSIAKRTPLLVHSPQSSASRAFHHLARRIDDLARGQEAAGRFFDRFWQLTSPKAA